MKQNRLLEDPVRSVFLSYLVPSVSATLVTSIYILADTMMIAASVLWELRPLTFCCPFTAPFSALA